MRKVTGIGETVYDIVFRDGQPQAAVPGGSTFNSMISVGRCGIPASFLSEVGSDKIGEIIKDFLTYNGVSTASVNTLPGKTPLSLAFLNENDDAEYSFYRDSYDKHPDFTYPELEKDDIVIFGSFYALNPKVRPQVRRFLEYARSREAIIYYDINFRPSHKKDLGECWDSIWENIGFADLLRGSHEDFHTLFGIRRQVPSFHLHKGIGSPRDIRCRRFQEGISGREDQDSQHHRSRRQLQRRHRLRDSEIRNHQGYGLQRAAGRTLGQTYGMRPGILCRLLQVDVQLHHSAVRRGYGAIERLDLAL